MAYRYQIEKRVEFSETDMAGIVHYSNFFRYMEACEHAFFRSLGLSIAPGGADAVGWPRVRADCDYKKPLRFEDVVTVELLVREKREKSLVYSFRFRNAAGEEVARGSLAVACIRKDPATGAMRAVPIPEAISALIEAAPAELLA